MANKPLSAELQRPLEGEIWKDVVGFEGHFQVSNMGRVKRLRRVGGDGRDLPERVLRTEGRTQRGYFCVTLSAEGRQKRFTVHRLVGLAFNGPPENPELQCCHRDGNCENNIPENLYWATPKQNSGDMVRHGRSAKGEKNPFAKVTNGDVLTIRRLRKSGKLLNEISQLTGIPRSTVSRIANGTSWSHVTEQGEGLSHDENNKAVIMEEKQKPI